MEKQPKKYIQPIRYSDIPFGNEVRKSYQKTILDKSPIIPKPLEYEDIDKAFFEFVENSVDIVIDKKKVPPTFSGAPFNVFKDWHLMQ